MSTTASLSSYSEQPLLASHRSGSAYAIQSYRVPVPRIDVSTANAKTADVAGSTSPGSPFVKQGRKGGVSLRLKTQENYDGLPVYGTGLSGLIEGTADVGKPEAITSIEVQVEGKLILHEIAEGGMITHHLCLDKAPLWSKNTNGGSCPTSLPFRLKLPATFSDGEKDYPLPPTYEEVLAGLPGFRAKVDYAVHVIVNNKAIVTPTMKSTLFGQGNSNVSTHIIYYPRTRPSQPLPVPLNPSTTSNAGFDASSAWTCYQDKIPSKAGYSMDIVSKLYLPSQRLFPLNSVIPFHLTFSASAQALAAFMPFGPTTSLLNKDADKCCTRIELLRQSTVDVRNKVILAVKTDIWRVDCIGKGSFTRAGDGPDWTSFTGEIPVSESIKLGGFKASGLSVKDCIVLTMTPPDSGKTPFRDLRQVIPIRLTTDAWSSEGSILDAEERRRDRHSFTDEHSYLDKGDGASEYSIPSTPEDHLEEVPQLARDH